MGCDQEKLDVVTGFFDINLKLKRKDIRIVLHIKFVVCSLVKFYGLFLVGPPRNLFY